MHASRTFDRYACRLAMGCVAACDEAPSHICLHATPWDSHAARTTPDPDAGVHRGPRAKQCAGSAPQHPLRTLGIVGQLRLRFFLPFETPRPCKHTKTQHRFRLGRGTAPVAERGSACETTERTRTPQGSRCRGRRRQARCPAVESQTRPHVLGCRECLHPVVGPSACPLSTK